MAEFTPRVVKRTAIGFHPTVLPTVYDDALSYYEELNKILQSLNDAIEVIDENRALILQLDANIKELDARLTAQIKQVADDLATLRKEYETFRDEVKDKIAELMAKDTEQDGRLTAVEKKNTQQDQRLTAIESMNSSQDSEINALKTRCATLETNLTSVTGRVSTLETRLGTLTNRVSTAEDYITELQGDVARIDQEQDVQDQRIKALEDAPGGGGVGSQWGTVEVYQLWNNDASNGSLAFTHFVRHVDLQNNKYNVLLNTGSCNSAVPLATLFTHKNFTVVGQPEIDELIITSWDPKVCSADAITTLKQQYTIKHAWIPSEINWSNYTGADKDAVAAVEAAVIKALHEGTNTEFTRMGDNGSSIEVGAINFDCLFDPVRYGVTSANMVCRIHCNCDMVVTGMDDITEVAVNNPVVRNWFPNMRVIDAPSTDFVVPKHTLDKVSKNVLTHVSYDQSGDAPVEYAPYMGLQWCNKAGGSGNDGYASVIGLGGDVPNLTATDKTVYVPVVGSDGGYVRAAANAVAEKIISVTGENFEKSPVTYTNVLPTAVSSDGGVYNTTGYKAGYRLNSSGAEKQITESYYNNKMCVTGFIPCNMNDLFRFADLVINPTDAQAGSYNICTYDSNFAFINGASWGNLSEHATISKNNDGYVDRIQLDGTLGGSNMRYIRFSALGVTGDSIITINQNISGGETADASRVPFNMAFVTDLHWYAPDSERLKSAAAAVSLIKETAPVDALVLGGDYVRNWSEVTPDSARNDISKCRECFYDAVEAPIVWLRGNHDCNPYPGSRLGRAEVFNRISREQETLCGYVTNDADPYGCYGFMDFDGVKTRVVFVNTSDNDSFGLPVLVDGYSALLDAYNIGAKQLQWIGSVALDFSGKDSPDKWRVVFVSHAPIYSSNSWANSHTYTDDGGKVWECNVVNLAELAKAYADKSTFNATVNGESVTLNFASYSGVAKVLCFVNGHKHALAVEKYNGFSFISCPNACNAGEKQSDDGKKYSKSDAGSVNETAFTVLTFDVASNKVYAWVYGAGYDRTIDLT